MKLHKHLLSLPPNWHAIAGALLTAATGWLLLATPLGGPFERLSYDLSIYLRHQFGLKPKADPLSKVAIVYIDRESLVKHGYSGTERPPRSLYGRLLSRLHEAGARLVVLDIGFEDSTEHDSELTNALRDNAPVIVGAAWAKFIQSNGSGDRLTGGSFIEPIEPIASAATMVGIVKVDPSDGPEDDRIRPRRKLIEWVDGRPTLARAAVDYLKEAPEGERDQNSGWLNYYGPAVTTIRSIKLEEALDGQIEWLRERIRGRTVFVGPQTDFRPEDGYGTPFTRFGSGDLALLMPGVEVHATTYCNLVGRDGLQQPGPYRALFPPLILGAAAGFGLMLFPKPVMLLVAGGTAIAVMVASPFLITSGNHTWWPWATFAFSQLPVAACWCLAADRPLGLCPALAMLLGRKVAFLSYRRVDHIQAERLVELLGKRGWLVYRDKDHMRPGDWRLQLARAIERSPVFLLLGTDHTLKQGTCDAPTRLLGDASDVVREEIHHAHETGRMIYLIKTTTWKTPASWGKLAFLGSSGFGINWHAGHEEGMIDELVGGFPECWRILLNRPALYNPSGSGIRPTPRTSEPTTTTGSESGRDS